MSHPAFSLQGKTILLNGMDSALGQIIAERCSQRGGHLMATPQKEQIHGLVHCIDQQLASNVADLSEPALMQVMQSNVIQPVMLTQQLLQNGRLAPQASILFLLSTAAHMGAAGQGAYAASKAALNGIIQCLALEQAAQGIRVNGISPRPDAALWPDVANSVVFLLSDASRWITGTHLMINGSVTEAVA